MQETNENNSPHQPVLYHESLKYIHPESGKRYVDGTLGAGGHAEGILSASAPDGLLLGLDIDAFAISIAKSKLIRFEKRCIIRKNSYVNIKNILKEIRWNCADGIFLDLGISSMQIDNANKGFSFQKEAPLDMRFDQEKGKPASELLSSLTEKEIANAIWKFGEEPKSRRIARLIIENRPITSTIQLAEIVLKAYKGKRGKIHPATKTFQALRIAVNDELKVLYEGLQNALDSLCPGGRLAVITFHSLEDRKVKQFFQTESKDCLCPPEQVICNCRHEASLKVITKKPVKPSQEEIIKNPRARSAKLRVAQKI